MIGMKLSLSSMIFNIISDISLTFMTPFVEAKRGFRIGWIASRVTWHKWNHMFTMLSTALVRVVMLLKILIMFT